MGSAVPYTFSACLGPFGGDTIAHPAPFSDLGRDVGTWNGAPGRKLQPNDMKQCAEV